MIISHDSVNKRVEVSVRCTSGLTHHDSFPQLIHLLLHTPSLFSFHDPLDTVLHDTPLGATEPDPRLPHLDNVRTVDELVTGHRVTQQAHPMLYGLQRGVPPAVREVAPDGPVPEDVFLR